MLTCADDGVVLLAQQHVTLFNQVQYCLQVYSQDSNPLTRQRYSDFAHDNSKGSVLLRRLCYIDEMALSYRSKYI